MERYKEGHIRWEREGQIRWEREGKIRWEIKNDRQSNNYRTTKRDF